MKVEIADSLGKLTKLEGAWNGLTAQCLSPSLYSSYDYNLIAWKHFSNEKDQLLILLLYDGAELKAIAPFCITRQKINGIPFRAIKFIAAWEGDKPSIIAPACEEAAWNVIYSFLSKEFLAWDLLNIAEQPHDSILYTHFAFLNDKSYFCQISHDSTSYYVDLTSEWEPYLEARSASVKKRLRKRSKMLNELPGGLSVETILEPERVTEALDRFAALEIMSWKGEVGVGIHKDEASRGFYEEFTRYSAEKKQAEIYFLKIADRDIASYINYLYGNVVYARHTAYDPNYSKFAPGIYLKSYILQSHFGTEFIEFDEMGMHPNKGEPLGKVEWASGTRETRQFIVLKKNIKLMPIILGKKVKSYIRKMSKSKN
jgi:CelD/BcsL family acetyltransferase involved in cellulose biosynthesis